ncbi:MAG: tetratricopeptide repeat protein [Thermodesulfobacteriota bacterium]|nr:tetratricopeptide repeat protein [Thermodesulfobacteriota bacterium]
MPDREIKLKNQSIPVWKTIWDQARQLTRSGDYQGAVLKYDTLLKQKPNLGEARWELARIRMELKEWDKASEILELLAEAAPERTDYLVGLGRVMQEKGQLQRAADLFLKAYEKEPDNISALNGFVRCRLKQGKREDILPYLEELNRTDPDDPAIQKDLAMLYFDHARYEDAMPHLVKLAESEDVDLKTLTAAARVHDKLGIKEPSAVYWQRVVTRAPENMEAHTHMASYYENQGRSIKALDHVLILLKKHPDNPSLLKRAGKFLVDSGRFDKALPHIQRYIKQRPKDKQAIRSLVGIHAALGNESDTLAALETYFRVESNPDPENLKKAARLYDAAGRFREAIPLYKKLLLKTPDDPEILAMLADDLIAIGEADGALSMWKHLVRVEPDRVDVYRSMADLLERLDRRRELVEMLETVHELRPDDEATILRLAMGYLEQGDFDKSRTFFDRITGSGQKRPEFFAGRGDLHERLGMQEHALNDYEEAVRLNPSDTDTRLKCIRQAGVLGLIDTVRKHLIELENDPGFEGTYEFRLVKAAALKECGEYTTSLQEYRSVLDSVAPERDCRRSHVLVAMSDLFNNAGLAHEAEQALRMALNSDCDKRVTLSHLFDLALDSGRLQDSEVWLNSLKSFEPNSKIGLMRVRLQQAKGDYRDAIRTCRRISAEACQQDSLTAVVYGSTARRRCNEIEFTMGRVMVEADRLEAAERYLLRLLNGGKDNLELMVLLQKIYKLSGETKKEGKIYSRALSVANNDFGRLLRIIQLYRENNLPLEMRKVAEIAYGKAPHSLKASLLLAQAMVLNDDSRSGLLLERIASDYPENSKAAAIIPGLLFKAGRLQDGLDRCEAILTEEDFKRPDILLQKARILWAMHEQTESMDTYKRYLEPSVDQALQDKCQALNLPAGPFVKKRTVWEILTFLPGKETGLADHILSVSHAVDDNTIEKRTLNSVAAPFYSRYMWQKRFKKELDARRSVQRREYFQAVNQYEALLEDSPGEESLMFDLAGIYSRLGRLEDEAALYERLSELSKDFPGLYDALERNRVKRRPRISIGYGYSREKGWDDYKDMEKESGDVSVWFSPRTQHQVDISASRRNYRSSENDERVRSKRAYLSYTADFLNGLSIFMGTGFEALDHDHTNTALLNCALSGKFGDKVKSRIAFGRDITADTTASLIRNIVAQDVTAAISVDVLPRLLMGGDFAVTDYSDGNSTTGYELWTSYIVFSEPNFLKFSYSYDFKDSQDGPNPGDPLDDGFAEDDYPYWSPKNFWINRFSLFFKHQFSDDHLDRGVPRYFAAGYSFGYDSGGYPVQTVEGGFFIELNPSFILDANGRITSAESYRSRDFILSASYRW